MSNHMSNNSERKPKCPNAGIVGTYVEKFDAYGCELCNEWLEKKCTDDKCQFCASRPEHPFEE